MLLTHPGPAKDVSERIFGASVDLLRIPVAIRKRDYCIEEREIQGDPFRVCVDSTPPPFC